MKVTLALVVLLALGLSWSLRSSDAAVETSSNEASARHRSGNSSADDSHAGDDAPAVGSRAERVTPTTGTGQGTAAPIALGSQTSPTSDTTRTTSPIALLQNHAPRQVERARPADAIAVDAQGRPMRTTKEIEGCSYAKVHPTNLERLMNAADFVGVLEVDYDYTKNHYKLAADGSKESSSELTPLAIDIYDEVLLNRAEKLPSEVLIEGKCDKEGLCSVKRCDQYFNSGPNLVIARRYCGQRTAGQVVMVTMAMFPVEGDTLYDQDGSRHSLSDLLDSVKLDEQRLARCDS